jgi:plasmid maintenance system antidote protein VapI
MSPQFWLNLQSLYDVRIAERKAGKAIRNLPKLRHKDLVHA